MIGPTGACGWTHYDAMAVPVGSRFTPDADVRYRAISGGPDRATRDAAIADECAATHGAAVRA